MCPASTPRLVAAYPARFHAVAYDELFDQNAAYRLDAGSGLPMIRSISEKDSSNRGAPEASRRDVKRRQSAIRQLPPCTRVGAPCDQPDLPQASRPAIELRAADPA